MNGDSGDPLDGALDLALDHVLEGVTEASEAAPELLALIAAATAVRDELAQVHPSAELAALHVAKAGSRLLRARAGPVIEPTGAGEAIAPEPFLPGQTFTTATDDAAVPPPSADAGVPQANGGATVTMLEPRRGRGAARRLAAAMVLAACLLIATLGSASALPGQPLYPLKRGVEEVRLLAAFSPTGKAMLRQQYLDTRYLELQRLAGAHRFGELPAAAASLQSAYRAIQRQILAAARLGATRATVALLQQGLRSAAARQASGLTRLLKSLSPAATPTDRQMLTAVLQTANGVAVQGTGPTGTLPSTTVLLTTIPQTTDTGPPSTAGAPSSSTETTLEPTTTGPTTTVDPTTTTSPPDTVTTTTEQQPSTTVSEPTTTASPMPSTTLPLPSTTVPSDPGTTIPGPDSTVTP